MMRGNQTQRRKPLLLLEFAMTFNDNDANQEIQIASGLRLLEQSRKLLSELENNSFDRHINLAKNHLWLSVTLLAALYAAIPLKEILSISNFICWLAAISVTCCVSTLILSLIVFLIRLKREPVNEFLPQFNYIKQNPYEWAQIRSIAMLIERTDQCIKDSRIRATRRGNALFYMTICLSVQIATTVCAIGIFVFT